jgi:murein DD-endopeptidase MepM/ murein hydrolase activator NlpD
MHRLLITVAIVTSSACAATALPPIAEPTLVAPPSTVADVAPAPAPVPDSVAMLVARLATTFDLHVTHDLIDPILHYELALRDLFHQTTERLVALAAATPSVIPDLTILTTQPIPEVLSSGYGWRDDPIRHTWKFHGGTDFPSEPGTPVDVAGDGVVSFAGRQRGYGNVIYVDHGGGVITLYGHLRRIETKQGATVTAGERIGQVGSTGRATGPHLHFEVRLDGRPVDPILAMHVAGLERTAPSLGHLASFGLAPEIQQHARAFSDRHSTRSDSRADSRSDSRGDSRTARRGRGKRAQVNW